MAEKTDEQGVIIVGGGPAGASAGLYAVRFGLKALLFDDPDKLSQAALAVVIEDYPGIPNISGTELVKRFKEHARSQGLQIKEEAVKDVAKGKNGIFEVKTDKAAYKAKTVVLATGAAHKEANIPGEKEFRGKGVSYCAPCDGPLFKGKPVVVVGGGDTALTYAVFLKTSAAMLL